VNKTALFLSLAFIGTGSALAADPATIDWGKVPVVTVPLFYPGQSSYEWLLSDAHKGAAKETRRGDACTFCHDEPDGEKDIGNNIVAGKRLEPNPPKGKNGHIDLKVQAAFDDRNAYLRFQWKTNGKPTNDYPGYRFDGKDWKAYGGPRLHADVRSGKQPAVYEDRVSIMIDDGKLQLTSEDEEGVDPFACSSAEANSLAAPDSNRPWSRPGSHVGGLRRPAQSDAATTRSQDRAATLAHHEVALTNVSLAMRHPAYSSDHAFRNHPEPLAAPELGEFRCAVSALRSASRSGP